MGSMTPGEPHPAIAIIPSTLASHLPWIINSLLSGQGNVCIP
jgi:hypothetical protein